MLIVAVGGSVVWGLIAVRPQLEYLWIEAVQPEF